MSKPVAADELLARLRGLFRRAGLSSPPAASDLTQREREVLGLLADGLDQGQIAARLVLSESTIGKHIERILAKLGAHSRAQAYRRELV